MFWPKLFESIVIILGIFKVGLILSQEQNILTPAYFNVAEGKNISATATCGLDNRFMVGYPTPGELYCKLTGNTGDIIRPGERDIIQGQYCDYCDSSNKKRAHPVTQAIDGTERWWQSPPLSRGTNYNEVNVTLDLGQQYHIAYIILKVANSPRPGMWVLERSRDYGISYEPWQYFAGTASDCFNFFNLTADKKIVKDDDVLCSTEYSDIVPLEDGEIVFSLVNDRPGATNFSYSEVLQEWTRATNIRLRLLRTNTLLGHLMGIEQQDPTVTRRYYYSIKDISVGGRCVCNGHADLCDADGDNGRLECKCQHNTCGTECEICCPGYVQKRWRPATLDNSNECEACNCHNHTNECYFDESVSQSRRSLDSHGRYEGGGVCLNCRHNTEGINCDECKSGYYRYPGEPLASPTVCEPCNCDPFYSTGNCAAITGQCECKPEFAGSNCSECSEGYYGYPNCRPCDCNVNGTRDKRCHPDEGRCPCKSSFAGNLCDRCEWGFFNFPDCTPCECNDVGSSSRVCDLTSGQCRCQSLYSGRACDECEAGYYNFPYCDVCPCYSGGVTDEVCGKETGDCQCLENFAGPACDDCGRGYYEYRTCTACDCDLRGSQGEDCDRRGQCYCKRGFDGLTCNQCGAGFYRFPTCAACNCDRYGSLSIRCDQRSGQCTCRNGYDGLSCDSCAVGFYNFPNCEECNCDPAGVIETPGRPLGGCGKATQGACLCKENVIGRTCDMCAPLFFNLQRGNLDGCESCDCFTDGTLSGLAVCDMHSGQCLCKSAVEGRQCSECQDGYYLLEGAYTFGCHDCGCDVGGSIHEICDKGSGKCICRPRITGRTCDKPAEAHFYPDMHQIKFEAEKGTTPQGYSPRIGYNDLIFPGFSYLGYAIMSSIQPVLLIPIDVESSSIYRIVVRYVYDGEDPVRGEISVIPSSTSLGSEQSSSILFLPSEDPQFVTVEGGAVIFSFVLNPGDWTVRIEAPEGVLLDYVVLVPAAFYEATILLESVADPCIPGVPQDRCNYYVYPELISFPYTRGVEGYYYDEATDQNLNIQVYSDEYLREELDVMDLAHLDGDQNNLAIAVRVNGSGDYIFIMEYYGGDTDLRQGFFDVIGPNSTVTGYINLNRCSFLCRSVVLDEDGSVMVFSLEDGITSLWFRETDPSFFLAVSAIYAIPVDQYSNDFIKPSLECLRNSEGECLGSIFSQPPGSVLIDLADLSGTYSSPPNIYNPDTMLQYMSVVNGPRTIRIDQNLPSSGRYVFVVHYYQPGGSSFDVNFRILGGYNGEGTFSAKYCPHISGCRSVVNGSDGSNVFELSGLDQAIQLAIPNDGGSVWIDYILAIPEDAFEPSILSENSQDRAAEFIQYCSNDGFFISVDSPELCRKAVFSISSEFNNGAVSCDCVLEGSTSLSCEEIAGQCLCKANIVGRTCDRCRIGFYDFPRCRPCPCPSGICNETDGACICPENTLPGSCDQCVPNTYGYDPLAGCVDCGCDARGIEEGNDTCNPITGQCSCKQDVGGRTCNQCLPGYFLYPDCQPCDCDPEGTMEEVCDQITSRCLCKANVIGARCDQCAAGTFSLDAENPDGCTACFCSGVSRDCQGYSRNRAKMIDMEGWDVTNLQDSTTRIREHNQALYVRVEGHGDDSKVLMYWVAPRAYLGNKLSSYGGYLEYSVYNEASQSRGDLGGRAQPIRQPDILLNGNGINLMYNNLQQPAESTDLTVRVRLTEDNFQYVSSGNTASRDSFMRVLANIDTFHIRAQYFDQIQFTSLRDVSLDVIQTDGTGEEAKSVERCRCPSEYTGLSCEECASGHYRFDRAGYPGRCVPCECNGHSDRCDVNTGHCVDCQDNTEGDYCDICKRGYYGNATHGVCQICSCPEPIEGQNFAESCEVTPTNRLICYCLPGHTGRDCGRCMEGFFGDPRQPGGRCRRCQCNGNSNPDAPGAECDTTYGNCLSCLPDTQGINCGECADGYYGDAVFAKNCQRCACNGYGSLACNNTDGSCTCLPNVEGATCDRCKEFYYNLDSGRGCQLCGCGIGSTSFQCHESGLCSCQPGVGGNKCDQCLEGFYDYTAVGCKACNCEENLRCDANTGECLCPIGAIGPQCDQCENGYIMTSDGCLPCDDCVLLLLDIIDGMTVEVRGSSFLNVSVGFDTLNKTKYLNESIHDLWDVINILNDNNKMMMMRIGNTSLDFGKLKNLVKRTNRQTESIHERSVADAIMVNGTLKRAQAVFDKIQMTYDAAIAIVNSSQIQENDTFDVDAMFEEANKILDEIRGRNFSGASGMSGHELALAEDVLARAKGLVVSSYQDVLARLQNTSSQMSSIDQMIEESVNNTKLSDMHSQNAEEIMSKNYSSSLESVLASVDELSNTLTNDIAEARQLNAEAEEFLIAAEDGIRVTAFNVSVLGAANERLQQRIAELNDTLNNLDRLLLQNATAHAAKLQEIAKNLTGTLVSTKKLAANALEATAAYSNIVDAIEEAEKAALIAKNASSFAEEEANGFGDRPAESFKDSRKKLKKALKAGKEVHGLEQDLNSASDSVDEITGQLNKVATKLEDINNGIDAIPSVDSTCNITVCSSRETVTGSGDLGEIASIADQDLDPECRSGFSGENCNVATLSDQAKRAKMLAMDASTRSMAARQRTALMENGLPELTRKATVTLPDDIDTANDAAESAQEDVTTAREFLTQFEGVQRSLTDKYRTFQNLSAITIGNLHELRKKIDQARTLAQGMHVAAKFDRMTSLRLRTPEKLESSIVSTLSMFFNTTEENAMLFFAGGPKANDDYLALEVSGGNPVFKFNNGDEDVAVTVRTNVADGQWHEAVAHRNGRYGSLTVYSPGGENSGQGLSSQDDSLLHISDDTVLLVGGVGNDVVLPAAVDGNPLVGGIDEIYLNGQPLGIWNFASATTMSEGLLRNVTSQSQSVDPEDEDAVHFDGNSYVKLENNNRLGRSLVLSLSFKTSSLYGLMFFAGAGNDFVSLEMVDGKCKMVAAVDGVQTSLKTSGMYANGKWTSLVMTRRQGQMKLDVEQNEMGSEEKSVTGETKTMQNGDFVYFGGLVGISNQEFPSVTRKGFLGCMKDVVILRSNIQLYPGVESSGVFPKCIKQETNLVSFPAPFGGYVSLPGTDFNVARDILFRFRSGNQDGLMLYMSDGAHENLLAVRLKGGAVEALFVRDRIISTSLMSNSNTYNDSNWHGVNIKGTNNKVIAMIIDDDDVKSKKVRTSSVMDSTFYVGGLPFDLPYNDDVITDLKPFVGCISDITMGSSFVNFADRYLDKDAAFNYCPDVPRFVGELPFPANSTLPPSVSPRTPQPVRQCALGLIPKHTTDPMDEGAKFYGETAESRSEYETLTGSFSGEAYISFKIKTAAEYGIIFYTSDDNQIDFTAMFLENGRLVFGFCYGDGELFIESDKVNDLQWHEVSVIRYKMDGSIEVDGKEVAAGTLGGNHNRLKASTPFYVGGLPNENDLTVKDIKEESRTSLVGCIKDLMVDDEELILERDVDVSVCQWSVEPGTYFEGGYVMQDSNFRVGKDVKISFSMKPRTRNGTIFSVQKPGMDFMSLEMRDGELFLTVENGGGEFIIQFTHENGSFSLCDGQWHDVQVEKTKHVAVMSVDGVTQSAVGLIDTQDADTDDPLYFGGLPDGVVHDGIVNDKPYIGCLRNILIRDNRESLEYGEIHGAVTPRLCPYG